MFSKVALACVVLPAYFGSVGIVDDETKLAATVEDVETLRVLVTNGLTSTSTSRGTEWRRLQVAQNSNPSRDASDSAAPDAAEDRDEASPSSEENASASATDSWRRDVASLPLLSRLYVSAGQGNVVYSDGNGAFFYGPTGETATAYTRAFYAPGLGAWIDTTLKVPYRAVEAKGEEPETEAADDDWVAAKRSLKGQAEGADPKARAVSAVAHVWVLDPAHVDAAIDSIAEILRKHGRRIRGLASDEHVVVALKVEGSGLDYANDSVNSRFVDATLRMYAAKGGYYVGHGAVPTETIVIRAPKSLLESTADGSIDAAAFKKRLSITRY